LQQKPNLAPLQQWPPGGQHVAVPLVGYTAWQHVLPSSQQYAWLPRPSPHGTSPQYVCVAVHVDALSVSVSDKDNVFDTATHL